MDVNDKKFFIATATKDVTYTGNHVRSLLTAMQVLITYGFKYHVEWAEGCPWVQMMRAGIVEKFMASDCSDLVFLDNDVGFEKEAFLALLASDKDVVAGIYPKKSDDCIRNGDWPVQFYYKDRRLVIEDGHIRVHLVPMGFTKIKRHVIEKLIAAHPELKYKDPDPRKPNIYYDLFHMPLDNELLGSEDWGFCKLWNDLGGTMWILPNIHFTHVGYKTFEGNLEDWLEEELARQNNLPLPQPPDAAPPLLSNLAVKYGTDKIVNFFIPHYEKYFAPFRNQQFTLLELGVWNGGSMRMWEEYFPSATIIGVDIDKRCKQYQMGRVEIEIGDLSDANFVSQLAAGVGTPKIIIDDASHKHEDQILGLEALFPILEKGGIYVVEDLDTSYAWAYAKGETAVVTDGYLGNPKSTAEYLKKLFDSLHYDTHQTNILSQFDGNLESIHLYRKIAFLFKRFV